ncbi:MAG: hypothetical protein HC930_13145 [Hydrococcus sp. SU_1_0]|nr:hypothetical protein [Hydrococcus sp. SU_1_0]
MTILEQAAQALQTNSLSETEQQQAAREAHTLIGSLGSFGLEDTIGICRQIEQIFKQEVVPSQIEHLDQLVKELRRCLEKFAPNVAGGVGRAVGAVLKDDAKLVVYHTASHREAGGDKAALLNMIWEQGKPKPRLLIIDDDTELNQILIAEAEAWGMQVETVTNLSNAKQAIAKTKPDVLLLDLCFPTQLRMD